MSSFIKITYGKNHVIVNTDRITHIEKVHFSTFSHYDFDHITDRKERELAIKDSDKYYRSATFNIHFVSKSARTIHLSYCEIPNNQLDKNDKEKLGYEKWNKIFSDKINSYYKKVTEILDFKEIDLNE